MVPTAAKTAKNEGLFREVNDRILELEERFGERTAGNTLTEFLCECSSVDCMSRVDMSVAEYVAVRERDAQFFVVPGHVDAEHERIVRTTDDRFVVVEKIGLAGEIAAEDAS